MSDKKYVRVLDIGFNCEGHGEDPIELVVIERSPEVQKEVGKYQMVCKDCARVCASCDDPCLDFYFADSEEPTVCYWCQY
jgi:hypothetical protein